MPTIEEINIFFDEIWKLYPRRKGKASVKQAKRKELYKVGYETLKICIERYKKDIENNKTDTQYILYGSTFFNIRYVDYLDENYEGQEKSKKKIQQHNFQERDFEEIEFDN